jgi:hypothetical protein
MLAEHILAESGGRYSLGERGEKLYGWKNFAELYAEHVEDERLEAKILVEQRDDARGTDRFFAERERHARELEDSSRGGDRGDEPRADQ